MPAQILITMDDLETAVPLNAAFAAAGYTTAMFSSLDDARGSVRRENPDLVVLTGAVHEPHALQLAALRRSPSRVPVSRSIAGANGCPPRW
jgi:DNA-binding response OmpR family regulator